MKNSVAILLGVFIVIAFGVFGWFFKQSRQAQQTIKVVGYGVHNPSSSKKSIKVTVSAEFLLK